jgi:hypothetical protein
MNINWEEIVKKYPKSIKKFEEKYSDFKTDCKYISGLNLAFSISNSGIYQYDTALCPSRKIGFDIFYILCEKFFDENDVIIEIDYYHESKWWGFDIIHEEKLIYSHVIETDDFFDTRDEAKEHALLKAFEIMEGQIK